ncbi:type II toxin-antitoxin system Rv0910 family toxin [Nocardia amikacinitolerans]|nr:SRPBCC family protein [Nocardia amikacinitolerans]MCP2275880.1 Polyketide cyclase / dehydrase and lipid transport [Nocardia amikacinitolerans]MCP2314960.1 Polyketide cyclase / dehydrase and lipid transport [Nocardia amikacinitolerans]
MAGFEITQELDVSATQIYSIIADTGTWGEWFMMHDGFLEDPPEHMTVNSKLVQSIRMLGMTHRLELTITAFKPPMQLVFSGSSPAGVSCEFSFGIQRVPGGCSLTIAGDFAGPMVNGQLGQVIERDARQLLTDSMHKLEAMTGSAGR